MHPYRPRFALSRVRELMVYSRWLLINNLIGFFKERTSDFFIGRLFGASSLGTYNIAYEFAHLPSTELSAPINRALLPGFAKMTDSEEVCRGYANALSMMAMLAVPCSAGSGSASPLFRARSPGGQMAGCGSADADPRVQWCRADVPFARVFRVAGKRLPADARDCQWFVRDSIVEPAYRTWR